MPTTQNVTRNNTDFPVQEKLITSKTEAITREMIQDKNRELYSSTQSQFIGLLQGHQKIYDHIIQKVSQTLDPK